jgi:uncharacterized membrane protein
MNFEKWRGRRIAVNSCENEAVAPSGLACGSAVVLIASTSIRFTNASGESPMAICSKCGAQVADGASFCNHCGQPLTGVAPSSSAMEPVSPGMSENVAGLLCYVLGWVTGLIFFFIDKRPFVRFHAAQSIVVFGGLQVVSIILRQLFLASLYTGSVGSMSSGATLLMVVNLLTLVLWIVLMIKAYQHQTYKIPVVAGVVESLAKK